jgi:ABC-type Zn uptake system ZnuABC Zn-binding protein ZnuA
MPIVKPIRFIVLAVAFLLTTGVLAQPTIVTSLHPHYDLVRQIVGNHATVIRLLPIGASPHTFDPTPRDVARVASADLVVFNGGLDEWVLGLVEASGTWAQVLELMEVLDFAPIEGDDHDDPPGGESAVEEPQLSDEHADHDGINPHIWLDPILMIQAVPLIVEALSAVDPDNAEAYRSNGAALVADLEALHTELEAILAPVAGEAFVPFHDAWPYFARRYGLNFVIEIEPFPGREPSPRYLAEALRLIEASGAKAIFSERQLPSRPAEIVAESAGVALYVLDPEGGGLREDETYQDLMRYNAHTIAEALRE